MTRCLTATLAFATILAVGGEALAQSCPPNSTLVSTSGGVTYCKCNAGYVMSGGQCVPG